MNRWRTAGRWLAAFVPGQVVVDRPASNRVTLLRVVDAVFADGFE